MSETPGDLVLSGAESRALTALARTFLSAVRNWALYPAEHPAVVAANERFRRAIGEAVDAKVAGSISVTPTGLLVGGKAAPDEPVVNESAALLHSHGILEIGFDPAVPPEALARLLTFLSRPPGWAEAEGGLVEAWARDGHAAIRIVAVDYRRVLEDHEDGAAKRDDIWRSIVSALASGTRVFDEREQQRLLEMAGDPKELAALAETLIADKCTPDGSPLVTTQAATVLASFRHLASIASVLAPDRADEVLRNLATALTQVDPRLGVQVLALEGESAGPGGNQPAIGTAFSEAGVAQLLASVLELEGQASPRLAQVFETLVPDRGQRRAVLDRARTLAGARRAGDPAFDGFWTSIEELLLSYNDRPYVTNEYRAMLDGAGAGGGEGRGGSAPVAEFDGWMESVGEDNLRGLSTALLSDLLHLETQADRAVVVLHHLVDLADELLTAGAYADALHVLQSIAEARARPELTTPCMQALARAGTSGGVRESAALIGDVTDEDFALLAQCYRAIGTSCLETLSAPLLTEEETLAADRVGDVCVAMGEEAIPELVKLLDLTGTTVRRRVATLLGRIASPGAVPALQAMLRAHDSRVIQAAVRALAGIDDPAAARAIQIALRAADLKARQMVVDALVAVADRRVVPMLVRVLENTRSLRADYQVVLHALDALARLGDPRAVRAASAVLFDRPGLLGRYLGRRRRRSVKAAAARVLILVGDSAARQSIERAAQTGDRLLRGAVRDAQHVHAEEGVA